MKELAEIISRTRQNPGVGALATVVQTQGSSYRRPGARMLILPTGQTVGSISGGCLEQDVIAHARKTAESGRAQILTYDTSTEEDLVFGMGLGCKGVVRILLEPVKPSAAALLDFAAELLDARRSGVVATIFSVEGNADLEIGTRMMVDEAGDIRGDIAARDLRQTILEDARDVFRSRRARTMTYTLPVGTAEVFFELIEASAPLVIFGAGFDAVPIVRLAKELGFHVSVADPRAAYATRERFPDADEVFVIQSEGFEKQASLTDRTAAIIMSHNYAIDRAFLSALLPIPLRYLGMMGPRKRAEKMLQELRAEGREFDEEQLRRLHNPVGLDIGAESPEQIALAILGEIQAVLANHSGGLLREKKGPIHAPRSDPSGAQIASITSSQTHSEPDNLPCPKPA